ncbi:hypothetical protein V6N12_009698 [Hibiscus sabdariffa]|uniref:Uncharacterized protein n=1 Tax=Hibiscus sabdariffa TaxID=183260 RepID=A0ABR2BUN4_9ROSI
MNWESNERPALLCSCESNVCNLFSRSELVIYMHNFNYTPDVALRRSSRALETSAWQQREQQFRPKVVTKGVEHLNQNNGSAHDETIQRVFKGIRLTGTTGIGIKSLLQRVKLRSDGSTVVLAMKLQGSH